MKANVFAGHPEYFSSAITSTSRIANIFIGREQSKFIDSLIGTEAQEEKYGHRTYLDAVVQADTDSVYLTIERLIKKKFGEDYDTNPDIEVNRLIEFTKNYIFKKAMPLVRDRLDNTYAYTMNAHLPEKLQEDPEIIADNFISIAPKMYYCRKFWDEGVTLSKPKLKITGLSTIRSNTPKFYRTELKDAMEILIDGNIPKVIDYISDVRTKTDDQKPEDIAINQGVSSLDYQWDESLKKFRKFTGVKYLGAPVNSRACLTHNLYIEKNKLEVKSIEPGDKISFLYMKTPNPLFASSNAFGFKDTKVFTDGLELYIDRDTMFEKGFMKPIKLITDPLKWDLTPKDEQITDDEW
jgi:DNA polymerase elongation subunit (family B)